MLLDVYYIVAKPVQVKDLIDYLFPYITLFERRTLFDHIYCVVLACFVLHFAILNRRAKHSSVDYKELKSKGATLGKQIEAQTEELLDLATKFGIEDLSSTS